MPTDQISLRLPKELLAAIDTIAKEELRTRTNMIEYILTTWMIENHCDELPDAFVDNPRKAFTENAASKAEKGKGRITKRPPAP
jgi:hypothetical protein